VAAIHESEDDYQPLGCGVVVDTRRVLTCAHVVRLKNAVIEPLWVAFPMSEGDFTVRRRVARVRLPKMVKVADVAVLELAEEVPAGVVPAPLRSPKLDQVTDLRWWAHGFADGDPLGHSAHGKIGGVLGYGWVRLDTDSRYQVAKGFSGTGLWSPDYQAVIGLVGQANERGDGRAITLFQIDRCMPEEKLLALATWSVEQAGETALAAWGWQLSTDPEARRHWRPRARGVARDSERGYRFRGRTAALTAIRDWLDANGVERRVLVVTGNPGVGKSAVLGRIVTTADPTVRKQLPPDDQAVKATVGSVACAVHAKGKTALDIATEIARAASAPLPTVVDDLAPAIRQTLAERPRRRFNLILDALDEAANPAEIRSVISGIVLPLAETCADVGARVVVGTRRRDDEGDLLREFGGQCRIIDLDRPEYFSLSDLTAYAQATLQLVGDERPGNPYADDAVAKPVARRIAELSERNFLVAGLTARTHGLHDREAVAPDDLSFSRTVDEALCEYLERLPMVAGIPAQAILTALAFAEAPGLPPRLWSTAISALGEGTISEQELLRFARSSAANFLIESSDQQPTPSFRLFHQALNDTLLHLRARRVPRSVDEAALTRAFLKIGADQGWWGVPAYLLQSLPAHAARAGMIDELLADDEYLLHADLRRLLLFSHQARSPHGRSRGRLLRLTPQAATASPAVRAAMFTVSEAVNDLGNSFRRTTRALPYRAEWASNPGTRDEHMILKGHTGQVFTVCAFTLDGRTLLASGGDDTTVRIWDVRTGQQHRTLEGHRHRVRSICVFTLDGRTWLATAAEDCTVRIWDPRTGRQEQIFDGHRRRVRSVCAFTVDGRVLLASASADRTVRIWNLHTGREQHTFEGGTDWVQAVHAFTLDGHTLLAAAAADGTVRIWDPCNGQQRQVLRGHTRLVRFVCAFTLDGRTLLASAGKDATVRIWDPHTGRQEHALEGGTDWVQAVHAFTLDGHTLLATADKYSTVTVWDPHPDERPRTLNERTNRVRSLCAFALNDQTLLASAGNDATVRIWDPHTGRERQVFVGHTDSVRSVCAFTLNNQPLLASTAADGTLRIWDPHTGCQRRILSVQTDWVQAVCAFTIDKETLLAAAAADGTLRIWDPRTGSQRRTLRGHSDLVRSVCAFTIDGRPLLASASNDATVGVWDPRTGERHHTLDGHTRRVRFVCAFVLGGHTLLASASADRTVRIWDPRTGNWLRTLEGHTRGVQAVCAFTLDGRTLLATVAEDRTARIWEPRTGSCLAVIDVQHPAWAVTWDGERLALGSSVGVLAIRPLPPLLD
jgi:WD40 repeat protein